MDPLVIRCKDLQQNDEFLFLNIPYKVRKISKSQIFYGPYDKTTGRIFKGTSTLGKNSMMRVTLIHRQ